MDEFDGGGEDWLVATTRAVMRATTNREKASEIADAVTAALGETGQFAWVGRPDVRHDAVRVRTASGAVEPPVVLFPDSEGTGPTRTTVGGEVQQFQPLADNPEYRQLRDAHDIPEATSGVSVPLGDPEDGFGVLHWYTDRDVSGLEFEQTAAELGEFVTDALRAADCRRELARERERLEAFRSLVSHDLGNPLNLGAGRLELARMDCESEHLDHVERALEQLGDLVDEGLTFVQAGKPIDTTDRVSLAEVAADCWDQLDGDPEALSVPQLEVQTDSERIRRILTELFRNALVHNDDVEVWIEPLEGGGFAVVDSGEGIPEKHREFVFDQGYTTDSDRDGNGLAIVAAVARAHGWGVQLGEGGEGTRIEILTDRW